MQSFSLLSMHFAYTGLLCAVNSSQINTSTPDRPGLFVFGIRELLSGPRNMVRVLP